MAHLKPANWTESIDTTLAVIVDEALHHRTEHMVQDHMSDCGRYSVIVEESVTELRARAVVLGAEVERLRRRVRTLENQHR